MFYVIAIFYIPPSKHEMCKNTEIVLTENLRTYPLLRKRSHITELFPSGDYNSYCMCKINRRNL